MKWRGVSQHPDGKTEPSALGFKHGLSVAFTTTELKVYYCNSPQQDPLHPQRQFSSLGFASSFSGWPTKSDLYAQGINSSINKTPNITGLLSYAPLQISYTKNPPIVDTSAAASKA